MSKLKSVLHHLRVTYIERIQHDLKVWLRPTPEPRVHFLVCGTQKGGTTALDTYLRQHPEICMPNRKELHFFDIEYNFRYQNVDYKKYHSFFDPQPDHLISGEVTPIYMYWQASPRRIWEYNPQMKLIILLRNPIQRAFSHWNMNRIRADETLTFWEALNIEEDRRRKTLPYQDRVFSYLDRGLYSEQLRRLLRFFPRNQLLIIKSKNLREHPQSVMDELSKHLGISSISIQKNSEVFSGEYQNPMTSKERDFLHDFYRPEIYTLEKMLGWDCSEWLEK
jgi:hypothetical protein